MLVLGGFHHVTVRLFLHFSHRPVGWNVRSSPMDSGLGSKFGQEDEGLDMSSPGLLDESLETKPLPNDTL